MSHRAIAGAAVGASVALATGWACSVDRRTPALACSSTTPCTSGRVCVDGYCVVGAPQDAQVDGPGSVCPSQCENCNFATMTCSITGTGGADINCPPGWNCAITCDSHGACGDVMCTQGRSCDVTCSTGGACGDITCGAVSCTTHCTGDGGNTACGNLSCTSSNCTASCLGTHACLDVSCTTGHCDATCMGIQACGDIDCGTGQCGATCTGSAACGDVTCPQSCRCDVTCAAGDCGINTCPMAPQNKFCTQNGSNGLPCDSMFAQQCHKC